MWINVTLGDILILEYGKSLPKNSRQDGKYPIFGSNGIIGYHNNFLVEGPVIIVGRKGSVGSVHFSNENCWPIDTTYFVKPTDSLNFKFIFFLLESLNLFQLDKSTTIPGLNRDNIYEQVIGLPPLNEQNRIVLKLEEVLSSLDKSKEQLENSLNQLNFYKQSILKQAFEGKLTEEWRKNKNDLKTPQQIINEINVCQDEQYKKELIDFNTGKTKLKPRKPKKITISSEAKALAKIKLPNEWLYIQLKDACHAVERVSSKERKNEDTFIYLDIGSINNNKNIIETYKEYQWKDAPSRAQYIIKLDDILFSTVRTYLKNIAMIEEEKFNHQIASSGFTVIRVLDNFIKPKYIFKYIVSDSFVQPLNELQSGSSYPAVRNSDVFDQFIPICSIEEQNVISEELDRQFSIINHFENTIEKHLLTIESLKQSVLRKAFEGKLSEQDSNDEPASILLERIKAEKEQYLVREKEKKNNSIKIIIMPEELKSILEILNENAEPISSKQLWLSSDKKDDIEEFYAELKKYIESGEIIELPRNGKESFLKLADKS
ncbi:MAG: restriction endonuclease subunit S [Bacilli bacterium]|nr:restriction endonuclease subunit S [Bacilli bacterium]